MNQEVAEIIDRADIKGWKSIQVEFGEAHLNIRVPSDCDVLSMKEMPALGQSHQEIASSLNFPIGSPHLSEIVRSQGKPPEGMTVCVTVSDITRPVLYKGENGTLRPTICFIEEGPHAIPMAA